MVSLVILRPVFEDRIISRRADVIWPPRSCDLTSLDYYLWSAVKDKCYAEKPETIDVLKNNIRFLSIFQKKGIWRTLYKEIIELNMPNSKYLNM